MTRRPTLFVVGLALLAGCGGRTAGGLPDDPDQLTVYSLSGVNQSYDDAPAPAGGEVLHGYPVLGKVDVADPARRREVVAAVADAMRNNSELQSKCFYPRHAVRAVTAGRTVDVVICFQCHNYESYRGDTRDPGLTHGISSALKPLLNKLLTDAGVPLAPAP